MIIVNTYIYCMVRDVALVPFVSHGRRGLGHRFALTLDRHCGIRFEARRTVVKRGSFFAFVLGLMREQTLSSTVLCPVIYHFPEQLCEAGLRHQRASGQRRRPGGDAMDQDKMSQLMLYT